MLKKFAHAWESIARDVKHLYYSDGIKAQKHRKEFVHVRQNNTRVCKLNPWRG